MEAFEGDDPTTAVLRINFHSLGCFHAVDYEFTFEFPGDNFLKVSVIEDVHQSLHGETESRVNRVKIGMVTLVGRDWERFMKLLDYYKGLVGSEGGCTTVDHLIFQKVVGEKALVLAEIEDRTCGTHDRLDLLTFDEILDRVHQANHTISAPVDPIPPPHPK